MRLSAASFVIIFLLISIVHKSGAQVFVNSSASGSNDGTSWDNAYINLQDALDDANNINDIWVAAGTYQPTVPFDFDNNSNLEAREATFQVPEGVEMYGGFAGTETAIDERNNFGPGEANETILSGDLGVLGDNTDNAYHVVYTKNVSNGTVLDGFSILEGNANGSSAINEIGGGWYNDGSETGNVSSPSIRNCSFINNFADRFGGALYNLAEFGGEASPLITNVVFENNNTNLFGGAVFNAGFNGVSNPVFTSCSFVSNVASEGGAVYNDGIDGESNPSFEKCFFIENQANGPFGGGAMFNHGQGGNSSPIIVSSVFIRNRTPSSGGAIYNEGDNSGVSNPEIINCTFSGNSASTGGAIYNIQQFTGEVRPIIRNTIFWQNTGTGRSWYNFPVGTGITEPNISYSLVQEADVSVITSGDYTGTTVGEGMLYATDPLFADPTGLDFNLTVGSLAINAGNNLSLPTSFTEDVSGNPRQVSQNVDLGAFENQVRPFITTWRTNNSGATNDDQIQIITGSTFNNYTIVWRELNNSSNTGSEVNTSGNTIITFPTPGDYTVEIYGNPLRFFFPDAGDASKVLSLEQWGDIPWTNLSRTFRGCTNLVYNAVDAPDLSGVTSLVDCFYLCRSIGDIDLTNWDVSNISSMQGLFYLTDNFNGDVSNWNVSNVTDFSFMFGRTDRFNGNLNEWDVSAGQNFEGMFVGALAFNNPLNNWVTASATNMSQMFKEAESFNQDLNNWDVSQVADFSEMFRALNGASVFNGNIENWDVSSGLDFSDMFRDALDFNQNISGWLTANATNFDRMFFQAISFDQDLSSWDVSNVTSMVGMFNFANNFNQSLGSWDISSVTDLTEMLNNSRLNLENYDSTLIGWATLDAGEVQIPANVNFGATSLSFCNSATERQFLIDNQNWTISDEGRFCPPSLSSFSPEAAEEGDTVLISGSDFIGVLEVQFGGVSAASFNVLSTSIIEAVVGNGSSGEISIETEGGTVSLSGFTFLALPSVTAFNPSQGAKGDTVIVAGTNFIDVTAVTFGGVDADFYQVISQDSILAVVGEGASGLVEVSTAQGTSALNGFNYLSAEIVLFSNGNEISNDQAEAFIFEPIAVSAIGEKSFTIRNQGSASLEVNEISSSNPDFRILSPPSVIETGQEASFSIRISQDRAADLSADITILSNSLVNSVFNFRIEVSIVGFNIINSETETILLGNEDVDIGSTTINVNLEKSFLIENTSESVPIEISGISIDNPVFSVINEPEIITPLSSERFTIRLNSSTPGDFTGTVTVLSSINDFSFQIEGSVNADNNRKLNIINAITPNGDGVNDYLQIENIEEYPNNELKIYNRWGELVFEIKGYDSRSKVFEGIGKSGEVLLTGNYYYVLDLGINREVITGYLFIQR